MILRNIVKVNQRIYPSGAFYFSRQKKRNRPIALRLEEKIKDLLADIGLHRWRTNQKQDIDEEEEEQTKKENTLLGSLQKKQNIFKQSSSSKWLWRIMLLGAGVYLTFGLFLKQRDWSYNEWMDVARAGKFISVRVVRRPNPNYRAGKDKNVDVLVGKRSDGKQITTYSPNLEATLEELTKYNLPVIFKANKQFNSSFSLTSFILPIVLIFIWYSGYKGSSNMMSKGAKKYKPVQMKNKIFFKDVAGMKQSKTEIVEFVEFLKKPKKFLDMGAKIPKGALLTGPPGTGKTLLAKACAGQAGVPFFYLSGSEFIQKYVGVGASRIRDLFAAANAKAPCIIFIDEIDAIGKKRSSGLTGNSERDGTLNQLLVCMDGFETNSKVIVMGATNRKDMLDPALLRPGRFDRIIEVMLPDMEERKQIVSIYLHKIVLDESVNFEEYAKKIAVMTPGFSGADLANLCNEAAIRAARGSNKSITLKHFEQAADRILTGFDKNDTLLKQQKKLVALKESATVVANWFLEGGDPVIKISILPRSKSELGSSQMLPNENHLYTKQDIIDKISCALAGRAIQQLMDLPITSFSAKSLSRVKSLSEALVKKYGMSTSLPNIAFPDSQIIKKPFSQQTQIIIQKDIEHLINDSTINVKQILTTHLEAVKKLSAALQEKEALLEKDIKQILGPRPFTPKSNYKAFLESS